MNVVGYLHHADLLLEDEQGMAIIGGGNYVLSVGDKVSLKRILDQNKNSIWSIFPLPVIIITAPMKTSVYLNLKAVVMHLINI
ncbi:hypothetical protein HADU_05210 [Acinetobacter sp. HA]|nr:hypothetical protein HADU_05210 [Acinetobacter sp. HA]